MGELLNKLKPATETQREMLSVLKSEEYRIVGLFGPTGTGKSLFSVLFGIDSVLTGRFKRLVISHPVIDVVTGREVSMIEAGDQYFDLASAYLKDILSEFIEWRKFRELVDEGKVVLADTHYLRGRTFDNSVIFMDDSQAVQPDSAIEALMRIGRNSKFIVAGDPVFQTIPKLNFNGASVLREVLSGEEEAKIVDLGLKDIVRPGARMGIKLLLELRMRRRPLSENEKRILDLVNAYAPDAEVITILDLTEEKEEFKVKSEHTPDVLIIVKEGYLGRLIGREGERINRIESEAKSRLRGIEFKLDFKSLLKAVHPVPWIHKWIMDVDFIGPSLAIKVGEEEAGAFLGQKGSYIRFLDAVVKKLIGISVKAIREPAKTKRR